MKPLFAQSLSQTNKSSQPASSEDESSSANKMDDDDAKRTMTILICRPEPLTSSPRNYYFDATTGTDPCWIVRGRANSVDDSKVARRWGS